MSQAGLAPEFLAARRTADFVRFSHDFEPFSHAHQLPPPVAPDGKHWTTWRLLGGRGAGKTRAGAEWVRGVALGIAPFATAPTSPIALVGETEHDAREVMVEGVSGLMSVHHRRSARCGFPRTAGWNGRMARPRRFFPPRTPTVCAARSFRRPGPTSSPSGVSREKQAAVTGQTVPSVVGQGINAVVKKK